MRFFLLILLMSVLAAGCGQRGALYFRDSPPAGVKPPKPGTSSWPGLCVKAPQGLNISLHRDGRVDNPAKGS